MSPRLPTWLVTGAHGFLGANLGVFLQDRAVGVGAVRGPAARLDGLYADTIVTDLLDPAALVADIEARRPDVIVHAAAIASHEACEADPAVAEAVNARAAGVLAAASQRTGSRFVLISTDAVFDGEQGGYREDDAPNPTHVYGRTKLLGEELAGRNPDALVVRTNFFGWSPSGRRSILEFFVNELAAGREVRGFTDFTVTTAYAQVLAQDIWDLVGAGATGVVHVAASDPLTKYGFGLAVAEEFGLSERLIRPHTMDLDPPRGRDLSLDVSRAERLLGRPLASQREGIRRAAADGGLRLRLAGDPGN